MNVISTLTFLGAAGTVTGSQHLLEVGGRRILVLPDSAHIQEEDAREANRHRFTKHQPVLPSDTSVDAARALATSPRSPRSG